MMKIISKLALLILIIAILYLLISGNLGHISLVNLVIGVSIAGIIAIRIVIEEQYLRTRYPDYTEYSHRTKRLIPSII